MCRHKLDFFSLTSQSSKRVSSVDCVDRSQQMWILIPSMHYWFQVCIFIINHRQVTIMKWHFFILKLELLMTINFFVFFLNLDLQAACFINTWTATKVEDTRTLLAQCVSAQQPQSWGKVVSPLCQTQHKYSVRNSFKFYIPEQMQGSHCKCPNPKKILSQSWDSKVAFPAYVKLYESRFPYFQCSENHPGLYEMMHKCFFKYHQETTFHISSDANASIRRDTGTEHLNPSIWILQWIQNMCSCFNWQNSFERQNANFL